MGQLGANMSGFSGFQIYSVRKARDYNFVPPACDLV
jgi:hypothetical protein